MAVLFPWWWNVQSLNSWRLFNRVFTDCRHHEAPVCTPALLSLQDKLRSPGEWRMKQTFLISSSWRRWSVNVFLTGADWNSCEQQQRGKYTTFIPVKSKEWCHQTECKPPVCSDPEAERTDPGSSGTNTGTGSSFLFKELKETTRYWRASSPLQASSVLPQYVLQQQQPEVLLTPQVVNLNPQMAGPFGPQGPQLFLPAQGNQLTPLLVPNGQQDQLGPPQDPNAPNVPQTAQNPVQVGRTRPLCAVAASAMLLQSYGDMNNCLCCASDVSTFPVWLLWISSVSQTAGMKSRMLTWALTPAFGRSLQILNRFCRPQGFPYFVPSYGYPQQRNTAALQPNNGQQTLERSTQRPQLPLQVSKGNTLASCLLKNVRKAETSLCHFELRLRAETPDWDD